MGLFGNDDKPNLNLQKALEKCSLENTDPKDQVILSRIGLLDNDGKLFNHYSMLATAKVEDRLIASYAAISTEQNWLILRQLEKLNKNIERLLDK